MGEIITLVKVPLLEIEDWLRSRYKLPEILRDIKVESDSLSFYFIEKENNKNDVVILESVSPSPKRRSHKRRNRMKTRGWGIVTKITNKNGQKCTIYKPFVDALKQPGLTSDEQKKRVEEILRSNKNKPSEESIRYFLDNTLEYIKGEVK